jgi:triphosphoribosyl-dephospho-CoA synthase
MSNLEQVIAKTYQNACLTEIEALKPGNVHIYADGHGMEVQDFIKSAEASARCIAKVQLTLGERIYESIDATWQAVNCNTNLGIVLLCAPIIQAAYLPKRVMLKEQTVKDKLKYVLNHTTQTDAQQVFDAIQRASPAGLGHSDKHDVHQTPQCTLLEAMLEAADRDTIAQQYGNYYQQIFNEGLPYYQQALLRWERPAWAATALYLYWLANYADSHITRKYNLDVAMQVKSLAQIHETAFIKLNNPKHYLPKLMEFDADLKRQHINPGTSADLTVVTIFLNNVENILN